MLSKLSLVVPTAWAVRRRGLPSDRRGETVTVAVVTDSAAALPAEFVERYGVTVVPMWITVGGRTTRDGETTLEVML
ncbi:MAG: DegV family protein, partial [Acidimicrobiia bacterium]|nr:DegV family protein [Acidimicrobiia bacterium]